MQITPNPYCRYFEIQHTDSSANWQAEIFDFFGNLLFVREIQPNEPARIYFTEPKNTFVVLRRNGEIVAAKTVLHYCR